jgi:transglutaminase-like putative cysteine protease
MEDPILQFFHGNQYRASPSDESLASSLLCNFNDPRVLRLQKKLFEGLRDPEKMAERAYDFIRRKILYAFDAWEVRADETLGKGSGMCFNKTNLMVALLRSAGVPAVYSQFWIRKEGFLFTSEETMFEKIQPETVHVYCEAYLGEKTGWRRFVETSLDLKLKRVLEARGYTPHRNIILERPIERYKTPEELLLRRKSYKESLGLKEVITPEDREVSNRKLEELRKSVDIL